MEVYGWLILIAIFLAALVVNAEVQREATE